jgi:hypothetical protein
MTQSRTRTALAKNTGPPGRATRRPGTVCAPGCTSTSTSADPPGSPHLDAAGKPFGQTLAEDPRISALARCLGDVVAAVIATPKISGKLHPTTVSIGVRAPTHNTDTPHAVVCLSWSSTDQAHQYATLLDRAFRKGASLRTAKPWKDILHNISTRDLGGSEHIVAWEADFPGDATLPIKMLLYPAHIPANNAARSGKPSGAAQLR